MKSLVKDTAFKRSQLEWILERSFERNNKKSELNRSAFRDRIKKLLELDRKIELEEGSAVHAFITSNSAGNGDDRAFSLLDIYLVGLALELINAGFTQQDIVFLFRYTRNSIEKQFVRILNYRTVDGIYIKENIPQRTVDGPSTSKSDERSFIITARGELREACVPKLMKFDQPVFYDPTFVYGGDELWKFLDKDTKINPHQFILECTRLAFSIQDYSTKAPIIKRGRKASSKP